MTRSKLEQVLNTNSVFVTNSEQAIAALREHSIGQHSFDRRTGPVKSLTPDLLRMSAEKLVSNVAGLADLVRLIPRIVQGMELAEADVRISCLVTLNHPLLCVVLSMHLCPPLR